MTKRRDSLERKRDLLKLEIQTTVLEYQKHRIKRRLQESKRHYEGGARTQRLSQWRVPTGSGPNAVVRPALRLLRERSRDLVRNNPLGESAASVMVSGIVGAGIEATIANKRLATLWKQWSESTQCDATGISNFRGLQTLAARSWAENGEVLFRRVIRPDWKPGQIPFAIQLLEPDYLDDSYNVGDGNYQLGIKLNEYGAPIAYRMFPRHPFENEYHSVHQLANVSVDIPVDEIGHVYLRRRVGQVRGIPALSPVIIRMRDLDDYEDAQLMRQKLASCFMAFVTNLEGEQQGEDDDLLDVLEPGVVQRLRLGENIEFANPPGVSGYGEYTGSHKHAIAAGLGIPYEELTGDYSAVSWSSDRLARMKFYGNLDIWQWEMFIPMFCSKIFGWFRDGATLLGIPCKDAAVDWTAPRRPVADLNEYVRLRDEIRAGLKFIPEGIRENGFNPDDILKENAEFLKKADDLGLVFDVDPRRTSGQGQGQTNGTDSGVPWLDGDKPDDDKSDGDGPPVPVPGK
ncbi:MAG: phage portal protein [Planctomycetaceae bacterium]|nr:phage portal protein [Planctomycetaceae bacterium]